MPQLDNKCKHTLASALQLLAPTLNTQDSLSKVTALSSLILSPRKGSTEDHLCFAHQASSKTECTLTNLSNTIGTFNKMQQRK